MPIFDSYQGLANHPRKFSRIIDYKIGHAMCVTMWPFMMFALMTASVACSAAQTAMYRTRLAVHKVTGGKMECAPAEGTKMLSFFVQVGGKHLCFSCPDTTTIGDVKTMAFFRQGSKVAITLERHRLMKGRGAPLKDDRTLSSYKVAQNQTLFLTATAMGGARSLMMDSDDDEAGGCEQEQTMYEIPHGERGARSLMMDSDDDEAVGCEQEQTIYKIAHGEPETKRQRSNTPTEIASSTGSHEHYALLDEDDDDSLSVEEDEPAMTEGTQDTPMQVDDTPINILVKDCHPPRTFELKEKVNSDANAWLLSMAKERFKEEHCRGSSKFRSMSTEQISKEVEAAFKMFKKKLIGMRNQETRRYAHASGKDFGRIYAAGLQGLKKCFRGVLCTGLMTDIDMANAHPTLLLFICDTLGIDCPKLREYVDHRDDRLAELMESMGVSRDEAKAEFLAATNDGKYRRNASITDFLKKYDEEMKRIQKALQESDMFAFIRPHAEAKAKNPEGTFINLVLCLAEYNLLRVVVDFVEARKHNVAVLMHDGLMIEGNHYENEQLLRDLEVHVRDRCGIDMKFAYKAHCKQLVVPDDFNPDRMMLTFEEYARQFDLEVCMVGTKYARKEKDGGTTIFTADELRLAYLDVIVLDDEGKRISFISRWLRDWSALDGKRVFRGGHDVFPPGVECPDDVLNIYQPFTMEGVEVARDEAYEDAVCFFKAHIAVLMNHNEACIQFMLQWLASAIQYPATKNQVVPVLISEEGAGKGWLMALMKKMLGREKVLSSDNPKVEVWGDFNELMKEATFVNINEAGRKDVGEAHDRIKGMIEQDELLINEKGVKKYRVRSYHNFLWTTNNPDPIFTHPDDRRFWAVRCSDELIARGAAYFKPAFQKLESVEFVAAIYQFLKFDVATKNMFVKEDIPETEYHAELKAAHRNPYELFLEFLVTELPTKHGIHKHTTGALRNEFHTFCVRNHANWDAHVTTTKFGTNFGFLKTKYPGCIEATHLREKGSLKRGWAVNYDALRSMLNTVADTDAGSSTA